MQKQALRERVWDRLEDAGEARFPFPPHDRIPNFAGAGAAADRLVARSAFDRATTVKSNPDAPQLPVRRRVLDAGTVLYMAVPRLRNEDPFVALHPDRIDDTDRAATISAADEYASRVGPGEMDRIDLIVAGSVAVSPDGDRVGKGEGYSDLEFAVLTEAGLIDRETVVATTVHEMQVVEEPIRADDHDVPMDLIVTPERTLETDRRDDRPAGIDWGALGRETIDAIPILQRLREE